MDSLGAAATRMFGILGVGFGMREFIRNSIEAQRAVAQLNAVIKSTGNTAGVTQPQLSAMASELQKVSTFSDEAIMGAQGLLLTFTKIKGATLTDATKAVLDLATAMGGDLRGAAIQVGKALQDPALGMTALRRSGVSFSEAQQKVIKDLFNTGRVAEAQRMILAELRKEFGGSAEAARNTLGGALTALKNAFGDVMEVSQDSSSGIIGALNNITDSLPGLRTKFGEFFGGIELMMVDASIRFQKFLRLMGTEIKFKMGTGFLAGVPTGIATTAPKGALTDAQLEQFRAEQYRAIMGLNASPATGGGGGGGVDDPLKSVVAPAKDLSFSLEQLRSSADEFWASLRKFNTAFALPDLAGNLADSMVPQGVDISDSVKIAGNQAKAINETAERNSQQLRDAIWGSATQLANTLVSAMNIGGGGKGSNLGGAIGGTAGFAIGFSMGGPVGGAIGSLLGNIGGSLVGGLFDSKKATDINTAAIRANTAALLLNSPSGYKTASGRFDATELKDFRRALQRNATRGGAPILVAP